MKNITTLKCKICGFEGKNLVTHLRYKHNITTNEYRKIYGECKFAIVPEEITKKMSEILREKFKDTEIRKKISDIQKNGASIFTAKYWMKKGYSEEEAKNKVSEIQKENSKKSLQKGNIRENSNFCKEFWIKRGFSEEEAVENIRKRQRDLSKRSSKFLGHKRTDEEKIKISKSMKKRIDSYGRAEWAKHFGTFNGKSKAEVSFYNYVKDHINDKVKANVIIGNFVVDVLLENKVIEFNGDYWHANPILFSHDHVFRFDKNRKLIAAEIWNKDEERKKYIESLGYGMLVIWENDWNKNKIECIEKIKKYFECHD